MRPRYLPFLHLCPADGAGAPGAERRCVVLVQVDVRDPSGRGDDSRRPPRRLTGPTGRGGWTRLTAVQSHLQCRYLKRMCRGVTVRIPCLRDRSAVALPGGSGASFPGGLQAVATKKTTGGVPQLIARAPPIHHGTQDTTGPGFAGAGPSRDRCRQVMRVP